MSSNFLQPIEFYQRRINPIRDYASQMGFYLSKMTNTERSICEDQILNKIKNKEFPNMVDPKIVYFEREDNGDRFKSSTTLSKYINTVNQNGEILAPTFTTYLNPKVKESLIVNFMSNNKAIRSKAKKESQAAEAAGDLELFIRKHNDQTNMKLENNSVSGSFVATGTVLNNPSAHSTLTSTTRSVSSLGNASNEKVIAGNRHYFSPEVTLNNIISITSNLDSVSYGDMLLKYGLVCPSVQDTLDCIRYSTDLYWRDPVVFKTIANFVARLTDVERAAFVYTGDLYHIRKYNPSFVKDFINELITIIDDGHIPDPINFIYSANEGIVNYVQQVCRSITRGKGKNYKSLSDTDVQTLACTIDNVNKVLIKYKGFIDTIFLSYHVPASTANITSMVRRTVVVSDTDSTLFSTDEFVEWYYGSMQFHDESNAVACSIAYIATECIAHNLALLSANIGVTVDKIFLLSMKSEYSFSALVPTSVSKHYFAYIDVKEGNVYEKPELEVKGVHLKDSSKPKEVISLAKAKMDEYLTKVTSGVKISIREELRYVANLEREIIASLHKGDITYFKQGQIKTPDAYTRKPEESPYVYHMFWEAVFKDKYGANGTPPYGVIKIPTIVQNITGVKRWLASIEDRELSDRLGKWLIERNKTALPTIYLPTIYVMSYGIPKEILMVMDHKRIVLDLTNVFRLLLETLGYYCKPDLLISQQY